MLQNLTGWHALIILAIVVLIFGAAKLPALAKSLGQSLRILKDEVAPASSEEQGPAAAPAVTAPETTAVRVAADGAPQRATP